MIRTQPFIRSSAALAVCSLAGAAMGMASPAAVPAASPAASPATTGAAAPAAKPSEQEFRALLPVVELFTSEGCSSCPSADKLLAELHSKEVATSAKTAREKPAEQAAGKPGEKQAEKQGDKQVEKSGTSDGVTASKAPKAGASGEGTLFIAYHVDYWDYLGWKDPFASAEFTARQRRYSSVMPEAGLYTPQMIVDGDAQFVGSDRRRADREILRSGKQVRKATVATVTEAGPGGVVRIKVTVKDAAAGLLACAALVEDGLASDVKRGENASRRLEHDAVARALATAKLSAAGTAELEVKTPAGVVAERASLIVFLQDEKTMKIVGGVRSPLPGR